uniref:Peptidase S1 domain-containing protein n=1 Tax=Rodentolepis nana TaxID=102285 RepID=A0A0R3TLN2_RODNA
LLQLNSSESIKHFIPQGISLNSSSLAQNNTETICKLLAPRHGYIFSFQVQSVRKEDSFTCKRTYGKSNVVSCFSQDLCLQRGLGGILTCPNSILGFYTEGADCYQGQIGWPVMASLVTPEIRNWIKYTVSMGHAYQCGYSPNEKSQSFHWYTYFNRTQSSEGICLVAYVRNDTFPLVTSVQCLKQCMNSILPKADGELGCGLDEYEPDMKLCPAKKIIQRLSSPKSPWTQCLIAYLTSATEKEIRFEPVRIGAFKDCDGEGFYNPFLADTNLCVRAMEDDGVLNCSSWGEAGLVQCKRSSDGLWEFLGFTKSCSARRPRRRWFIRSLEL